MAGISTIIIYMPVLIFMGLEAGRPTAKGFVKYPMIVALLAQFFGISVVFPLLWIPSYIWGGGARGLLSKRRILLSVVPPMVYFILSVLTLFFVASPLSPPTKSMVWTTSAGILGGPFIAFSFVPLWLLSQDDEARNNLQSANLSTLPYGAIGVGSFFVWLWSTTLLLLRNVGLSPSGIYQTLWGQAVPAVKFFTLDGLALWLSMLLVIAYQKETSALEAIGLTCLFGPGTGIALVLAGLQVDGDEYEIPCLLEPTIDLGKSKSEILKRKGE